MDDRASAVMADMPPSTWREARRRLALVRRYVDGGERSAAEAERLAREAGIGRSLFYRLVRIYEARPSTRNATPVDGEGEASSATNPTVEAISEAITRLGAAATQAKTLRAASALCQARVQPLPTPRMVRVAFTRELAGKDLAARFGATARLAFDRTVLDLVLETPEGITNAQLSCVIDLQAGRVVRHRVTAGPPALYDVAHVLAFDEARDGLVVSASDEVLSGLAVRVLSAEVIPPPQLSRWRMGAVVRAALGLRLGRVNLLERAPAPSSGSDAVDLDTARQVVGELLRRSLEGHVAPRS